MKAIWIGLLVFGWAGCHLTHHTPSSVFTPVPEARIGLSGDSSNVIRPTQRGFLLAGGADDVDAGMKWLANRAGRGDLVVLRASGGTGYNDYWFELSGANSVETLLVNSHAAAYDPYVIRRIQEAEGIFIGGGDQARYLNFWQDTPMLDALNAAIRRNVPIGGTSAGLAVLGEVIFDAKNDTVTSDEALPNPYHQAVSLTNGGFLRIPELRGVLTDSHYTQRNRQGRHVVFLARMQQDFGKSLLGIGVDEQTAVTVDEHGIAHVWGVNEATFIVPASQKPEICQPNQPLTWNRNEHALRAYVIQGSATGNGAFNVRKPKTGTHSGGTWKRFWVDQGAFKSVADE